MINKKRGQITVFIIIAVILLFSSAIYFYYLNYTATSEIEPAVAITTNVPQSVKPIFDFVDNCLEKTADDAIVLIGQQGGHIYLDGFQEPIGNSFLGDMLQTFPDGGQYIPYWYYDKNGVSTTANIPQLNKVTKGDNSIQDQIERYVRENLDSCIDGFRKFSSQGFKITEKKLQSGERFNPQVTFTESGVVTNLQYPLNVEKGTVNEELGNFRIEISKKVKKMYELAKSITEKEKDSTFLEYITLISMSPYQRLNKDFLPPFMEPERFEDCSEQKIWDMGNVGNLMNNEVLQWVNLVRFNRTEGFKKITADDTDPEAKKISQAFYDRLIINLNNSYPEINVEELVYPMRELSINDISIGPLFPTSSTNLDLYFFSTCLNKYEYYYNFDYPILFTLTDNTPNDEYAFQFPIQVAIKDNWPRISSIGNPMNISEDASLNLLECNKDNFDSGKITLITKDKTDSSPVANANVYYQCGILGQKCYIGPTTTAAGISKLESKFPKCLSGGALIIEKPNYLSYLTLKNFKENTEEIVNVNMTPIKEMDLDIKKYLTNKNEDGTCSFIDTTPKTLGMSVGLKKERVILTISKLDYENGVYNIYPTPYDSLSSSNKLKIAPGKYKLNMMLVKEYNPPLSIPCTFVGTTGKCMPEGGMDIETELGGGNNITFTITENDMTKNKIKFYVTDDGEPGSIYDVNSGPSYIEACKAARPDLLSKVDFE